jgi:hypothetical protein
VIAAGATLEIGIGSERGTDGTDGMIVSTVTGILILIAAIARVRAHLNMTLMPQNVVALKKTARRVTGTATAQVCLLPIVVIVNEKATDTTVLVGVVVITMDGRGASARSSANVRTSREAILLLVVRIPVSVV